ncbi:MAG: C25 family cysteine peptidase [Saprospiraceae bacterium]|nr:C25 family cysteine peptidase [Saprospiraceae bacterium]
MRNLLWILLVTLSTSLSAQMEIDGELLYGNEWIDYNKTYVKVSIEEDGIYRISRSELEANGVPVNQISLNNLNVIHFGKDINFYVDPSETYIEFYGVRNRSELDKFIYLDDSEILNPEYSVASDVSSYFITWSNETNPLLISSIDTDLSTNTKQAESYYWHHEMVVEKREHYKPTEDTEKVRYSNFVSSEGFGTGLYNQNLVEVPISNVFDNGSKARVKIRYGGNKRAHRTKISINETPLDTVISTSNAVLVKEYEVGLDHFESDQIQLSLHGLVDEDSDNNIVALVETVYPRNFKVDEDTTFLFHIEASGVERYFEIEGYALEDIPIIYEIKSGLRIVPERTFDNKIGFILPASNQESEIYLASTEYGLKEPMTISERTFVDYNNPDYNYLLITSKDLRSDGSVDWVQEYADYRASETGGSFRPVIADVDQLYDQFAFGVDRHFIAFRNFGYWAKKNYTQPEFMFIIGKGREYRENRFEEQVESNIDAFIPPWGNPGSDNMILASDTFPLPIFPIGRLAAKNAKEIEYYLDKVKVHEGNINIPQNIEDKHWQKKVLHLSGGDVTLQEVIANSLRVMEDTLENNYFGADVTTFYKKSVETIETPISNQIFDLINDGLSIITFFGHSSVGKFDFSIDNIDKYENSGKYPLVFSLGCYSGNIHSEVEGISEQFIVREDRGAICFIAAAGTAYVGQQYNYGLRYYERIGNEDYGKPIGTVLNNVIEEFSDRPSYTYITFLQQLTLHGDPAVRLAAFESPDLVPDAKSIRTNPTFIDTYEDDYEVCFDVANIGKSVRGEYDLLIEHYGPDGTLVSDSIIRSDIPKFKKEYCIKMPIPSTELVGKNTLKITVDVSDELEEVPFPSAELNNKLFSSPGKEGFEFYILSNSAIPIYPKEFSIVNQEELSLVASTYNAFGEEQKFVLQIDTTESFNSPLVKEKEITDVKGVVEWKLDIPMESNTVYYWRISPDSTTTGVGYVWSESSFVYDLTAKNGWNQSHYYQFLKDDYSNMFLEENREFFFAKNLKEIIISNKVWENMLPAQFILDNDSQSSMLNKKLGPAIAVAVIDTLGRFVQNPPPGLYGSYHSYSVPINTYYFRTNTQASRIDLLNFLEDRIEDRFIVCVYTIHRDFNSNFYIEDWAADSLATNGVNIFNYLEGQGSLKIRDMEETQQVLPFAFIYEKNVSPLAEDMADDLNGTISVKELVPGFWFEGSVMTDFIGPSKSWDEVEWELNESSIMENDTAYINIYGYNENQENETLLYEKVEESNFDLSDVDVSLYPFLKVEYYANDYLDVSPPQLNRLRVYYKEFGDIAINSTEQFSFYADSLQQGDEIKLVYELTNFSKEGVPASKVEYRIIDAENNVIKETRDIPEIEGRESKTINFNYTTRALLGDYQFQILLNPDKSPKEDYYFNNFGIEEFKVTPDKTNPLLNVMFDGMIIMDQDIVSSNPMITIELLDENPFLLLESPENFTLLLQDPNGETRQISIDDPEVDFYPAQEEQENKSRIEYNPELLTDGEYKLTVEAKDESSNNSGTKNYEVRFRVYNEEMVSNVFNYPNPFSTSTQFVFTLTGNEEPGNVLIRIMTLSGKVVREITSAELGLLRIGTNRTEYRWDGRDEFGDKLGNGTYLYQVITKKMDGSDYKHFSDPRQNNTDYLFKKGFGKLVIIR